MVYNWQRIKMKKVSIFVTLLLVSAFSINSAYAENTKDENSQSAIISEEYTDGPTAYVSNVQYDLEKGTIEVSVRIKGGKPDTWYRVKVTPTNQISGVVVEGSLYLNVNSSGGEYSTTFHCATGKEGEAQYCRAYTFNAQVVGEK